MNKAPLVSIIIPAYNYARFLPQAIESVLNQTYKNWECIIVDDGSTDETKKVVELYLKKDGRITYICHTKNKGLAAARNTGIQNCSGDYIQLLDADDWLDKSKIKLQLEFSENQNDMVSYCEIARYYDDSKHISSRDVGEIEDIFPQYYTFWSLYPTPIHSLLFKKEIFEKFGLFDEELRANEDRHFLSKLAAARVDFRYFPFIGGFYRLHECSMNKERLSIIENSIRYYKKLNEELGNHYFVEKFGYTWDQMMYANLTYIYLGEVAHGLKRKELKRVRKLLREQNINFYVAPIPSYIKRFKIERMFLASYLRRWLRHFIFIKRGLKRLLAW